MVNWGAVTSKDAGRRPAVRKECTHATGGVLPSIAAIAGHESLKNVIACEKSLAIFCVVTWAQACLPAGKLKPTLLDGGGVAWRRWI